VAPSAYLPIILPGTRLHGGLVVALLAAVVLFVIVWRSPIGYQLRAVGSNVRAARFAGMNVIWIQIMAMLVSGGLAGLAGTAEILGAQYRLREFFLPNYGYDAIAVALLGQLDPIGVAIAGILFGALRAGAGTMQRTVNLPSSLVFVVQGTVVFFVVCAAVLRVLPRYYASKEVADDD
jgi:simple sugar transport system permease protein